MNLLNGFTGLFSLGQAGFMLLGAYAYAVLCIPVAKRAGVYQQFEGGLIQFSLPETFANLFGEGAGTVVGILIALLIGGLIAALMAYLIGLPVLPAEVRLSRHRDASASPRSSARSSSGTPSARSPTAPTCSRAIPTLATPGPISF